MLVIYRLCGLASTNPSPICQENKNKLNELCLRSFVEAFKEVNPTVHFIIDFPTGDTVGTIEKYVPFSYSYEVTSMGINNTMLRSYELANSQDEDILFQECDYLYLPNTGKLFVEAVKELDLVSPYDHLNFYLDGSIHSPVTELTLLNGHHFRTTERNTMTFGVKNKVFKENYEIFKKYGYLDGQVWHDLRSEGYYLWTPIPALATHMVKDFLSPGVDWKSEWEKYL